MISQSELRDAVQNFIADAVDPAILDRGEEPLRLMPGQWQLSEWNGRLMLEAWTAERNLARRIVALSEKRRGRLSLVTERFPKTRAELQIADLSISDARDIERRMSRLAFRERFALMLARDFPQYKVEEVSAEANLEQSLSPAYPRGFLRSGRSGIAVIAAPPDSLDAAGVVPFGLIWLEYLRCREKEIEIRRLLLYVRAGQERDAAFRLAMIDKQRAETKLLIYDDRFRAGEMDPADVGNVDSTLPVCTRRAVLTTGEAPQLGSADVESVEQSDGSVRYEVRGLEFARWFRGRLICGIGKKNRATLTDAVAFATELSRVRSPHAEDRQHPLYMQNPEGWLESQVRSRPDAIDASLRAAPLYGQVPIFGGRNRGVVDLLGIDDAGRLVVVELKASADLQLPFQALDYWLRVKKHLDAGDFERHGYFPEIPIRKEPPRILLVAPALQFHSTSEMLIGYMNPGIEIVRVGVAADWRAELKVVLRLRGAEAP